MNFQGEIYKRCRRILMIPLAAILCFSLVMMGGLIWINNTWAIMPDDDPATSFDISAFFGYSIGQIDLSDLDPDGDGQIPLAGGKLLRGNGDQDDNKQDPIVIVYRLEALVETSFSDAPVLCQAGQMVKSYLDFGHLKVFPDVSTSIIIKENTNSYSIKAAARVTCGDLYAV